MEHNLQKESYKYAMQNTFNMLAKRFNMMTSPGERKCAVTRKEPKICEQELDNIIM